MLKFSFFVNLKIIWVVEFLTQSVPTTVVVGAASFFGCRLCSVLATCALLKKGYSGSTLRPHDGSVNRRNLMPFNASTFVMSPRSLVVLSVSLNVGGVRP